MRRNKAQIEDWRDAYEGGYVNHPEDPGGATNRGVTQRMYDAYRVKRGLHKMSVRHISNEEVDEIYDIHYWQPIRGDDLPDGLDASVYDMMVHSGNLSVKFLQRLIGVDDDGHMGPITLAAIPDNRNELKKLIVDYNDQRLAFLKTLRHWSTFKNGWKRRVVGRFDGVQDNDTGVVDRSIALLNRQDIIARPKFSSPGRGTGERQHWLVLLIKSILDILRRKK